jgi:hypothetical protein
LPAVTSEAGIMAATMKAASSAKLRMRSLWSSLRLILGSTDRVAGG